MNQKLKEMLEPLFGFGIIGLIALAIISLIALLGGLVMRLFGFQYESVGSLILFFIVVAIAGLPAEMLARALPKALLYLGRIGIRSAKALFVLLDALATVAAMVTADYLMDGVSATNGSILVFTVAFSLISMKGMKL